MGDIRADLEKDLAIAEADVEESKRTMDRAVAEHSRLRDIRAAIKVQLLKLDLVIGSTWKLKVKDPYYNRPTTYTVKLVFVDETHVIYLRGSNPERMAINTFTQAAKVQPNG